MIHRASVLAIALPSLLLLTAFDLSDLIQWDSGKAKATLSDGTRRFETKDFGSTLHLLVTQDLSEYRVKHCRKFEPLRHAQRNELLVVDIIHSTRESVDERPKLIGGHLIPLLQPTTCKNRRTSQVPANHSTQCTHQTDVLTGMVLQPNEIYDCTGPISYSVRFNAELTQLTNNKWTVTLDINK